MTKATEWLQMRATGANLLGRFDGNADGADSYTFPDGSKVEWNGAAWKEANPDTHQVWVNTKAGTTHIVYRDGFKPTNPGTIHVFSGNLMETTIFARAWRDGWVSGMHGPAANYMGIAAKPEFQRDEFLKKEVKVSQMLHGEPNEDLADQVYRLSSFIIEAFPGEPSKAQGAVDTAIRLLKELGGVNTNLHSFVLDTVADWDEAEGAPAAAIRVIKEVQAEVLGLEDYSR